MYYTQTIPAELTSFKKNDLIEEDGDFYFQPAVNIEINKVLNQLPWITK